MLGKFTPKQNLNIPPLKYDFVYNLKKDFPQRHEYNNLNSDCDKDTDQLSKNLYEIRSSDLINSQEDNRANHEEEGTTCK